MRSHVIFRATPAVVAEWPSYSGFQNAERKITLFPRFTKQAADYPLGLGTPEDVGNAVLYHLSDGSKWLTGNCMVIDGGYSLK